MNRDNEALRRSKCISVSFTNEGLPGTPAARGWTWYFLAYCKGAWWWRKGTWRYYHTYDAAKAAGLRARAVQKKGGNRKRMVSNA